MPVRSRTQLLAGIGALLGVCVAGPGCQSKSLRPDAAYTGVPEGAPRPLMALGRPEAVSQPAGVIRPAGAVAEREAVEASSWRGPERVGGAEERRPAARAAIDMPRVLPSGPPLPGATTTPDKPLGPPADKQAVATGHVSFHHGGPPAPLPGVPGVPREFEKQMFPDYIIEPPDVLRVIALKAALDAAGTPLPASIIVKMDGTASLGIYGTVRVAGLTIEQARQEIARTIWQTVHDPAKIELKEIVRAVAVDVLAFNSKFYYVITDGGGYGEQVYPIPIKGNETVLDAIAQINGLPNVASKKKIWLARATAANCPQPIILPVDWCSIAQRGVANTNYQIFPNDRIYVGSDSLIAADSRLAKIFAPINRVFGVILLGSQTVNSLKTGSVGSSGPVR